MNLPSKLLILSLFSTQCLLHTFTLAFTVHHAAHVSPQNTHVSSSCNLNINPTRYPATTVTSTTALALTEINMEEVESYRKLFYLWFFGGSGGGGIAIAAFPAMYTRFDAMRSLKNEGPTLGGESIGLSPLCLYPRDLSLSDVEKVLNQKIKVEQMVSRGPMDSFWAQRGYLRYEAFVQANQNCNPLAVRAIFDALTTSTSTVEPDVAQELLDSFKGDVGAFKRELLKSKVKGYAAIGTLLILLGLAADVSGEALAGGWFPEWPGNDNFPVGLVSPGVWTIPDYWI
jgi:hypothetical protein